MEARLSITPWDVAPNANNEALAEEVLDVLPRYLPKEGVVAVGEIGYDDMTSEEDKYFAAQLELAIRFDLPWPGAQTYMLHCHNLEHEDGGMMLRVKVG